MTGEKKERTKRCPLCGKEIPISADVCPYCGAHLDIFELEEELSEEDTAPLESFLDSIGDEEDVDPESLLEEMKRIVSIGNTASQDKVSETVGEEEEKPEEPEAEGTEVPSEEPEEEEEVEYVCPVCGGVVGPDDNVCPHCGAIFVDSDEELEELLEEQLTEAKSLIKTMREKKMDVSDVTPLLKNANIAKRKGDMDAALDNAIACVMKAKEKLQAPSNSS